MIITHVPCPRCTASEVPLIDCGRYAAPRGYVGEHSPGSNIVVHEKPVCGAGGMILEPRGFAYGNDTVYVQTWKDTGQRRRGKR